MTASISDDRNLPDLTATTASSTLYLEGPQGRGQGTSSQPGLDRDGRSWRQVREEESRLGPHKAGERGVEALW